MIGVETTAAVAECLELCFGHLKWGVSESETVAHLLYAWRGRERCLCYVLCTQEAINKCLLMSQR